MGLRLQLVTDLDCCWGWAGCGVGLWGSWGWWWARGEGLLGPRRLGPGLGWVGQAGPAVNLVAVDTGLGAGVAEGVRLQNDLPCVSLVAVRSIPESRFLVLLLACVFSLNPIFGLFVGRGNTK